MKWLRMVKRRKLMCRLKVAPQNQGPYRNQICKRKKNAKERLPLFD